MLDREGNDSFAKGSQNKHQEGKKKKKSIENVTEHLQKRIKLTIKDSQRKMYKKRSQRRNKVATKNHSLRDTN